MNGRHEFVLWLTIVFISAATVCYVASRHYDATSKCVEAKP